MDLNQIARLLAVLGFIFLLGSGLFYLLSKSNLNIGKLPGDILIVRENFTCVIPLVSSLLISIVITIILNVLLSILRK